MNSGILLAAGSGSRFGTTPKQMYILNEKPVIQYSIDLLSKHLDRLIIVTNTLCFHSILPFVPMNAILLVNDVNCRLQSIKTALDYLQHHRTANVLIHDAARPFISEQYILDLLESSKKYAGSQYYMKLLNGLARKKGETYKIVNREEYIELCTPQIMNYDLYDYIFRKHLDAGVPNRVWEILPVVKSMKISYNLIEGSPKYLRKLTTLADV